MRTRNWILAGVVVLLLAAVGWWWRHSSSPATKSGSVTERLKPTISMASVNVSDIDADRIKLTSKVILKNPLPIEINTNRLSYEIYIDSVKVIQDSYSKPIRIKSSDSTVVELPLELLAKPMARVLKYFDKRKIDSADYSMKATFLVDVPIAGERNFTMHISKRLPALRIPEMKVKDMDLHLLQMKKKGVDMVVQVINPNAFPLKMKDAKYSIAIEDAMHMNGTMEKIVAIPAHGSQDVSMHADVEDAKVLKTGWKLLFEKKDTRFKYNFRCKLLTDSKMLQNSNMAFSTQGTLAELVDAVKKAD